MQSPAQFYPGLPGFLMGLDSIEIHRDATVEELKALILTLPAVRIHTYIRTYMCGPTITDTIRPDQSVLNSEVSSFQELLSTQM